VQYGQTAAPAFVSAEVVVAVTRELEVQNRQ